MLLVVPMVFMTPTETASDNPGGPVYELQDTVNTKLPRRLHGTFYLVEARKKDVLTQEVLWELYQNTELLRSTDEDGELNPPDLPEQPYLFNGFDVDRSQPVIGISTLADAVHEILPRLGTTLASASDEQVKVAVHLALQDPATEAIQGLIYKQKIEEERTVLGHEIDYRTAPALGAFVAADNEKLGGGSLSIGGTGDPVAEGKEHFARKVQRILRGQEESYQLWGVAIDTRLETAEEVGTSVPFIVATFLVVLVVVGITLRSKMAVLLTAVGLMLMIVWLKGLSNLVGLKSSTVLDFIVPIAMISLGADFVIHAVSRYREELREGLKPRMAFRVGMGGVLGALVLAMLTDGMAFLSNVSAEIEVVIGFGIGAGLAIVSAFIIMGLGVPLALMRLDHRRERLRIRDVDTDAVNRDSNSRGRCRRSPLAGAIVTIARWRFAVIPITALVTIVAGYYAIRLESTFDVKDFFRSDSGFVVGLNKLDEYVGDAGGESAVVYVQGDLTDPASLAALTDFLKGLKDNAYVAKNVAGEASLQARPVFWLLEQVIKSEYVRAEIERETGVFISTEGLKEFTYGGKVFRWPGSQKQLKAIYDYIALNGVFRSKTQKIYDRLEVGETLFHDITGTSENATTLVLGIPGTRDQTNVTASRDSLTTALKTLEEATPSITKAGLTGSPYTRQAGLDATTIGLQRAFPIAVVACLLIAIAAMRSIRMGAVTIIPIGLVVAWLYGFMYLFGFGLNFITATIAAVSIGVGVDYAIHMTERFREELNRCANHTEALHKTAQGTGAAIMGSAATSILGFAIMAFAPMPMFSSYGVLTAVMILMAAVASLLVLPSLLLIVAPSHSGNRSAS